MELKNYKPTAEVTIETKEGTLVFTVERVSDARFEIDYRAKMRASERCIAILSDAIVGWNLDHDDGTPWECTPETKPQLLEELVGKPVLKMTGPDGKEMADYKGVALGLALFGFVRDKENFLKN